MHARVLDDPGGSQQVEPVLRLKKVSKTFAGTRALRSLDLEIAAGEVHALVGQNGSGKSTLIKVLAGYHEPDPGAEATINGRPVHLGKRVPEDVGHLRFVHQDLGLILEMSAVENLALSAGFTTGAGGRVRWREQAVRARQLLWRLGAQLDVHRPLREVSPVDRTIVAIAGALAGWTSGRGLLVLDEPTAVLPHTEVDRLLDIVREVRRLGASVLYVSHRLEEIFQIADRVTVLRDGQITATRDIQGLDTQLLAELMVGDKVDAEFRLEQRPAAEAEPVLAVEQLHGETIEDFAFTVHRGEILGIAGFPGSGAEELPYLLAGARSPRPGSGRVKMRGDEAWSSAEQRLREERFPLVPADRATEGIIANFAVGENLTLQIVDSFQRSGWLADSLEQGVVRDWLARLEVKSAGPDAPITSLSGGNQQKVVMGRCLATEPDVLILAEPTAGVDVGSRQAIYELIGDLAEAGLSVVVTSTDTTDLLALCSRVLVLVGGRIGAELTGERISEQRLLNAMEGQPG